MQTSLWEIPDHVELLGEYVSLLPLDVERDAEKLFNISHGELEFEAIWTYLPFGPFTDSAAMRKWLTEELVEKRDNLGWVVFDKEGFQIGMVAFLAIASAHGRAEIGHVWFTPSQHKTKTNTESQYLLLKHLFDRNSYRRAEWKCHALNHASRTAATRMGFIYEGRFRQHMYIRGQNRDTDWFAMTDKEWPRCKENFEKWLYSNDKSSLMRLNNG